MIIKPLKSDDIDDGDGGDYGFMLPFYQGDITYDSI